MTTPSTPKTTWVKALEIIDTRGWAQKTAGRHGKPCCVGGALSEVITGDPSAMYSTTARSLDLALLEFTQHVSPSTNCNEDVASFHVQNWNDDDERTIEDVRRALAELIDVST